MSSTRFSKVFIHRVINHIERLGFSVAMNKTEAMVFHSNQIRDIPDSIDIEDATIAITNSIKYLGIMLDPKWTFMNHFKYVEDKVSGVNRALSMIMPNLRGHDEKRRRLYASVTYSVILYGAPVWGDASLLKRTRPP